jgi:hypothetical protein
VKHFVSELLVYSPTERYTATQALQHPWVKGEVEDMTTFNRSSSLQRMIDETHRRKRSQMQQH